MNWLGHSRFATLLFRSLRSAISQIMKSEPVFLYDDQKVDDIAETISKYNLLAVPVVDRQ